MGGVLRTELEVFRRKFGLVFVPPCALVMNWSFLRAASGRRLALHSELMWYTLKVSRGFRLRILFLFGGYIFAFLDN